MTLVLNGAGRLQQIQWGVNELASSLFVGKQVGTVLSRKSDTKIFRVLQTQYGVKVKSIPPWMESLDLNRNFSVLGEGMRRIDGATSMEEVSIHTGCGDVHGSLLPLCANHSQTLRFSDSKETATYMSSDKSHSVETDAILTVFGGLLELVTAVSSALDYNSTSLRGAKTSMASRLREMGFDKGHSLSWAIKPMPNRLYPLRFKLLPAKPRVEAEIALLAQRVSKADERLTKLPRDIAGIIDETYLWTSYTSPENEMEMTAAMYLVNVAMAVGSLHKMTQPLADGEFQYALNLKMVERDGSLANLCPKGLTEGLSHQELLWAASTLWGGASPATQGYAVPKDSVQGIVAPHCIVILEIIRNPLRFVRDGVRGKVMTMCRGSVPLLPRDPNSGFVLGRNNMDTESERQEVHVNDLADSDPGKLRAI